MYRMCRNVVKDSHGIHELTIRLEKPDDSIHRASAGSSRGVERVHEPVSLEVRVERDPHESGLAFRENVRQREGRLVEELAALDDANPARALGDEQPVIGGEGQGPGYLQVGRDHLRAKADAVGRGEDLAGVGSIIEVRWSVLCSVAGHLYRWRGNR